MKAKLLVMALGVAMVLPATLFFSFPVRADAGMQLVVLPPISKRTDFYGGAVIPLKFQLFDSNGMVISDATGTAWVNGTPATTVGHANVGNMFRFDPKSDLYIYNLNTKPLPAGPGSPPSTIEIMVVAGGTTMMESFTVTLD